MPRREERLYSVRMSDGRTGRIFSVCLIYSFWILAAPFFSRAVRSLSLPAPWGPYLSVMASSLPMAIAVILCSRFILSRSLSSLIDPSGFRAGRYFAAFASFFLTALAATLIHRALVPSAYESLNPALSTSLLILPAVILCTLVQTGAEEFMMRIIPSGILPGRLASSLLCALIFVAPHLLNREVAQGNAPWVIADYALFGFAATYVSLLQGGFEFSLACHMANNLFATMVVTYPLASIRACPLLSATWKAGSRYDFALTALCLLSAALLSGRKPCNEGGRPSV